MDHEIRGWNECLITYVLAAAAPRYGVDPLVYHRGFAAGRDFLNGKSYYDIKLPLGMPFGGPLFFSSLFLLRPGSPRSEGPLRRLLAAEPGACAHQSCPLQPRTRTAISATARECWGLTASDDPDGYAVHDPANDNGTISPTAALSSLPYTPHESLAAIRHFLRRYGNKVWGRYGFVDAFCERRDWYADTFLAIDQGPIIIMMENHRSGLLWRLFMSHTGDPDRPAKTGLQQPATQRAALNTQRRTFEDWIEAQYHHCAHQMLRGISATDIIKQRPGFGQSRAGRMSVRWWPPRCSPPTTRIRTTSFTGTATRRW